MFALWDSLGITTVWVPVAIVISYESEEAKSDVELTYNFKLLIKESVTASIVISTLVIALSIAEAVVIVPTDAAFLLPILIYFHALLLLFAFWILQVKPSLVVDQELV